MQNNKSRYIQLLGEIYSICAVPCALFSTDDMKYYLFPTPTEETLQAYRLAESLARIDRLKLPMQIPYMYTLYSSVLFCLFRADENNIVIFGPAALPEIDLSQFLQKISIRVPSAFVSVNMKLINGAPRINTHYLSNIVIHAYNTMLGKTITSNDIIYDASVPKTSFNAVSRMLSADKFELGSLHISGEIYNLVRNGDSSQLKKRLNKISRTSYYYFQENSVNVLLFGFVFYSAIICHYAVLGGLGEEKAQKILNKYIRLLDPTKEPEYFWNLLPRFIMEMARNVNRLHTYGDYSEIVTESLKYIKKNLYGHVSVTDLQDITNASTRTITRHFIKYLSVTPAQYISDTRLDEAASLLINTDFTIARIAGLLNYSSQTHLNRNFIRKFRCTPLQYRKAYKQ